LAEQFIQTGPLLERAFPEERARVVRLATALTGSPEAAEDLAQEALLEAWRSRHKLVEPEGASRWLSVITRNVCLRWLREQGRASTHAEEPFEDEHDLQDWTTGTPDLEIELERSELAELLDRALAKLPAATRTALVQRYILELPQAEIAARLGLSEGAVEARLQRGKISLHRLLVSDYRPEAVAFGLAGSQPSSWVETRIRCPICGRHPLYGTLPGDTGQFELHCPNCSWSPGAFFAQSTMIPDFALVKGYRATLKRFMAYMQRLFEPRQTSQTIPCQRCGQPAPIQFELPPSVPVYANLGRHGVYILCPRCGSTSHADIYGLALNTLAGQRFWQANPRMRTLPAVEVDAGGRPALLLRFESLANTAALELTLSRDRYTLLDPPGQSSQQSQDPSH
jgi:RNA polymerase sigma factor (sigma-70 family)